MPSLNFFTLQINEVILIFICAFTYLLIFSMEIILAIFFNISGDSAPIKAVFQNPRSSSQIYIVLTNSITYCMSYNDNKWTKKHTFQLSNAKGVKILSVMFHRHTSMFFWCEQRGAVSGAASCCVCMREVSNDWDTVDFTSCISPVVAVIQCCPVMSLFIINKGVAMVPELPDEHKQLLFFWTFVPRSLKVIYISSNVNVVYILSCHMT